MQIFWIIIPGMCRDFQIISTFGTMEVRNYILQSLFLITGLFGSEIIYIFHAFFSEDAV